MNDQISSRLLCVVVLLGALMMLSASPASATNLRGRVDYQMAGFAYPLPMPGALVELFPPGAPTPAASTRTGADGMYYFLGVPPGTYSLWINQRIQYPVGVGPVVAQDVPPILVR